MENWIEVLKFTKKVENIWENFLKLLNDENIPYKKEIQESWEGSGRIPRYEQYVIVYIPQEYKETVEKYLQEYTDTTNNNDEDIEELKEVYDKEEKEEYKKRNIAKKIMILTPFIMVGIAIICGIISSIIY